MHEKCVTVTRFVFDNKRPPLSSEEFGLVNSYVHHTCAKVKNPLILDLKR